jgi:serine/threonine protein kinase
MISQRYTFVEKLGAGASSEVYLVWDRQTETNFACKVLKDDALFANEMEFLTKLKGNVFVPDVVEFGSLKDYHYII